MTTAATMQRRLSRLREKMADHKLDAFFITAPVEDMTKNQSPNRRYVSGFTGSMGNVVITADRGFVAVDFRYWEQALKECPHLELFKTVGPMKEWLPKLLEGLGGRRIGLQPGDLTLQAFRSLEKAIRDMPEAARPRLVVAPPIIEELRLHKDPDEIETLQRAITLGDRAFEAVSKILEPGWTETRVAWEIEKWAREHGAEAVSFSTIVACGPWSAAPHASPRDLPIEEGKPIVIDMGVVVDGYVSDLTRTITLGTPSTKFREIYDIVFTAQQMAIETIEAGMTGEQAHMIAHNVIEEAGYGDHFGHGLGHGVGVQVHEAPRLARTSPDTLEDGMVFSIEPGIYLEGWGGVRIEDLGVLENGRVRVLSHAPKLDKLGAHA